jgi:multidrug resistance efflux pump
MPGQDLSDIHSLPGHEPAGVYVSLAEAAALTGQHPEALRAKARRGRIPALRGNDGTWRVQVPAARPETGHLPDQATKLAELERDVARLGEQLARAEAGRDAAIAQAKAEAQVAIARAERAAAVAEAQAAMLRETVADLRARLDRAEARLAVPWWRRLLGT